jgi:glycogen(starch) synthase
MKAVVRRVLMTTDSVGAVWTYALNLSRALGKQGVEVVLLSMGKRLTQEQHRDAWSIPSLSIYEEPLRVEWMNEPWHDVRRAGEILLSLEQRFAPDVIHLNNYAHAALPFRAPVLVAAQSCALSWWRSVYGSRSHAHLDAYRARVMEGLRRADMVVSASRSMLRELVEHYGPFRAGHVIPQACDPEAYLPDVKEELVFAAGRLWDPGRNLAALARVSGNLGWSAFSADDEQHPPGTLHTIELMSPGALQSLGRLGRAEFASWLGRASIYVQPSRYEASGISALQAACCGCALVLGDIPSQRELWEDVAVFVSPDDSEQLEVAIQALIAHRSSREALAHAARERALQFTLREAAASYIDLYDKLVSQRVQGTTQSSVVG